MPELVSLSEAARRLEVSRQAMSKWLAEEKDFPATVTRRPLRRGVSVAILKGERRKRLKGAFLQTMRSGHRGVFVRAGASRLPILERKVISPVSMWKDYIEAEMREAGPYLQRRMAAQLARLLKGQ